VLVWPHFSFPLGVYARGGSRGWVTWPSCRGARWRRTRRARATWPKRSGSPR